MWIIIRCSDGACSLQCAISLISVACCLKFWRETSRLKAWLCIELFRLHRLDLPRPTQNLQRFWFGCFATKWSIERLYFYTTLTVCFKSRKKNERRIRVHDSPARIRVKSSFRRTKEKRLQTQLLEKGETSNWVKFQTKVFVCLCSFLPAFYFPSLLRGNLIAAPEK